MMPGLQFVPVAHACLFISFTLTCRDIAVHASDFLAYLAANDSASPQAICGLLWYALILMLSCYPNVCSGMIC